MQRIIAVSPDKKMQIEIIQIKDKIVTCRANSPAACEMQDANKVEQGIMNIALERMFHEGWTFGGK